MPKIDMKQRDSGGATHHRYHPAQWTACDTAADRVIKIITGHEKSSDGRGINADGQS